MPESRRGFDANLRLYAQMQPDGPSLAHLLSLQESLPAGTRLVPRKQLHLTLIHFGKVLDVHRAVNAQTGISRSAYEQLLAGYVARTEALLPAVSFRLGPVGFAGFGTRGSTLVVEYLPTPDLALLHRDLYRELVGFLGAAGIRDTAAFIAGDPNFIHAGTLRPHISLARGFAGALPSLQLESVTLQPMPVVYPGH
ncbi:2'-5' RNA ligase family protein [Arthrobacter sp. zg-Y1110]|uniref:2'-5' RNA ligase family protein n=1 Tax=Arthrobacter sp. zg-Y1110 TaxID=2886932 RepID=UPI001D134489|nr:2'-5' RNA ligase family protein [Arthrobacter sp. zg-Y1110]MCC3291528.1 2'-5' RNA ligase family protein [Arthrobacter sp. zg-Y1110]UWX83937.1 2'-5' RNA ligase family protein [Arthrobacter sp. zg-Y1110]